MSIQSILVPVDFSPASRQALDTAVEIGAGIHARIELLFVEEALVYRGVRYEEIFSPETREQHQAEVEQHLEEWAASVRKAGVEASWRRIEGDPRRDIVKAANESKVDLVVIGARGRSRVAELLLGSVAHEVARDVHCSALLVR